MMAAGFRFDPFDEELIDDYLKPEIRGEQLPSDIIKHKQIYGPCSDPWCVFNSGDWFRSPALKKTEKCTFVFAKLSKLSKSKTGKNTSKRAGCGTWVGKGKQDKIEDCDGNLIGEKRYLVFEINNADFGLDSRKFGKYKMYEYTLCGVNSALLNSDNTIVLCKIIHDSSQECHINPKSSTKIAAKVLTTSSSETVKNVEGTSCVSAGDLTVLESGAEWPAAAQYNNNELGDFCEGINFDDLGGVFGFTDSGENNLSDWDINWLMESLDSDLVEEPSLDNCSSLLKRKCEYEDLYQSKKICL